MMFTPKVYATIYELNTACIYGDAHSDTQILNADGHYVDVFGYVGGVAFEIRESGDYESDERWLMAGDAIDPAFMTPRSLADYRRLDPEKYNTDLWG